ncbi:hypothetical protein JCM19235_5474 [Vibrio maritimus]|uniref:Uncharacterized protein n=1 Tax=Vibrio maritimus TaxID=990268 RepID=A0A090RNC6_9VIBR|nr:hypothetical protein JCM19235_5474 [Vibrio maritimus]
MTLPYIVWSRVKAQQERYYEKTLFYGARPRVGGHLYLVSSRALIARQ